MNFRDDEEVRGTEAFNVPYADSERSIGFGRDFGIGYRAGRSCAHAANMPVCHFYFVGGEAWCRES
jgi:hypothetical protein